MEQAPQVAIIAHRGLRLKYPENTISSINAAISLDGLSGVEFDVEMTNESVPLVLHQETMIPNDAFTFLIEAEERDYISRDWVAAHTAADIMGLDAGSWKSTQFAAERIPHLRDVMALNWRNKTAYIELKDPTYWATHDQTRPSKITSAIKPFIENKGNVVVLSFNQYILSKVKEELPSIQLMFVLWTEWQSRQKEAIQIAQGLGVVTISLADKMVLSQPEWVSEVHRAGMKVCVYPVSPTIEEPEYATWGPVAREPVWERMLELGVDFMVSDFAPELLKFIADKK